MGGEVVAPEALGSGKFDLPAFIGRNSKELRFPEIETCIKSLKQEQGFKKLGVIGFCWGGWAAFQLGAKGMYIRTTPLIAPKYQPHAVLHRNMTDSGPNQGKNLVDCISIAHPSLATKEDVDAVSVPVQIIAPEHDPQWTPELREYANSVIPSLNLEYDYQYFPGSAHGFAIRSDPNDAKQKKAFERAKNVAVAWFAQFLHLH